MPEEQNEAADKEPKESPAPPASQGEHMIPKSRLDEEISKRDKAERELKRLQEAEEKRKRDEMTELEQLKADKADAETRAQAAASELERERTKNKVVMEAGKPQFGAGKAKFVNPEVAYKLLTPEQLSGDVVKGLADIASENPYLLESQTQPKGDRIGSPRKGILSSVDDVKNQIIEQKRRSYTPL